MLIECSLKDCLRSFGLSILFCLIGYQHILAAAPPGEKQYLAAIERLGELAKKAKESGEAPRKTDAEVAAVLARITDLDALLGTQSYGGDDAEHLWTLCGRSGEFDEIYTHAGIPPESLKLLESGRVTSENVLDVSKTMDSILRKINENMHAYQDELLPLWVTGLRCQARVIPAVKAYLASLPEKERTKESLSKFSGLPYFAKTMTGAILFTKLKSYKLSHRQSILRTMAENAEMNAEFLSVSDRQAAIQVLKANLSEFDEALQPDLKTIIAAFSREDCTGFCAYADGP